MTARITARALAALASLAIVIAACGNGAATTAPATQAAATTVPATQVPATQGAAATGGPSSDPLASFHGAQDLEAFLPNSIGGVTVTKASVSGTDFMALGASDELQAALTALNKTPADLKVAFGSAGTETLFAFQVNGVPGTQILSAMFAAEGAGSTVTDVTLGGKAAKKIVTSGETDASYVYTSRDVVFVVAGSDITDAMLNEIFSALP